MKPIRRVLMTADAIGGVWTYALELCRGYAAHGIKVLLAVMGPEPSLERRLAAERWGNVKVIYGTYALRELEAVWRPDVCHLNGYTHGAGLLSAPTVVVAHSCVDAWVGSSRVDLQACKLEYSIVSPK